MYNHSYPTFTSLYTLLLKDISPIYHIDDHEDKNTYPKVGDVLIIKEDIGNYMQGDFFFVHAQDEDEVSDCSIVGVAALNAGLEETIISDIDIYNGSAEVLTNSDMINYLWDQHIANHITNTACCI